MPWAKPRILPALAALKLLGTWEVSSYKEALWWKSLANINRKSSKDKEQVWGHRLTATTAFHPSQTQMCLHWESRGSGKAQEGIDRSLYLGTRVGAPGAMLACSLSMGTRL